MPSAYAVLYSLDGWFLLAFKAARGYYFGDGANGAVYQQGVPLNGGNNYALPGGAVGQGETLAQAAEREFFEETAYVPPDDNGVISHQFTSQYGAAYFLADDAAQVGAYQTTISLGSLPHAWTIANAIYAGQITAYNQIPNYANTYQLNPWPHDNELQTVYLYNILDDQVWNWIQTWSNPASGLDWYYNVLAYLRQTILQTPIARDAAATSGSPTLRLRDGSRVAPPQPGEYVPTPTRDALPPPPFD
jgi:ADP-ribose pyrophosphatase YjhB (NUDIX family)